MGYSVRVLPGLSSVQLLAAAVGRPWQSWKLVSAHGRACDPVAECMAGVMQLSVPLMATVSVGKTWYECK